MQRKTQRLPITRYQKNTPRSRLDRVAVEEPLEIRLHWWQGKHEIEHSLSVTMRTPGHDFALAAGFLYTEGVIEKTEDIRSITHCLGTRKEEQKYNVVQVMLQDHVTVDLERLQRNFYTTSSCGVCGRSSIEAVEVCGVPSLDTNSPLLSPEWLHSVPTKLRETQEIFEQTGGLHAAALFQANGELLTLHEDVGRHNAVDKLVGQYVLNHNIPLDSTVLSVSGRVSFDIVQKALRAGIPVLVAIGAPSSLAIDLADSFGMTLVGFLRNERFNVYTGAQRFQGADSLNLPQVPIDQERK